MTDQPTTPVYRKREYLSISTLLDFARCPRRYFYKKCGLEQNEEPLAPIYGNAMHKAVPIALMQEDLAAAMMGFKQVWSIINEVNGQGSKWNLNCAERSLSHFIHTHKGSKSLYKLMPPPVGGFTRDEKVSDYEVSWAIDIGLAVPLTGRMDGFCTHRDTGETWIWEFKTTKNLNDQFFDQFRMNSQVLTYALVGRTFFGKDVKGVMIEGMKTDPKKIDNMTYPVIVKHHHLEEILKLLQYWGMQLLEMEILYESIGAKAFLKDYSGCTPYSNFHMPGYTCEFVELCDQPDWTSLTDMFVIKPEFNFIKVTNETEILKSTKTVQCLP